MVKSGEKIKLDDVGTQLVVTRGGEGEITAKAGSDSGGLKVGKRYQDVALGIQVLVARQADATLFCNGVEMVLQEPKKTKSAD